MARHLGFRVIDALTERVGYRELTPFGLSQFDLRLIPDIGAPRSGSTGELRALVEGLQLPRPAVPAAPTRRPAPESAPLLARVTEGYREAVSAAMKARGSEAILVNVLDPNREVNPQYLNYVVRLTDGRTLTGMIAAESATSLSLRRADNQQDTVLRIEIDQLKSSGQSLMPEGMERQIDKQQMADLLEYLRGAE